MDCDPGIDDAVTLALAATAPEIDLLAVTTVSGNVPLKRTSENARVVLNLVGRADVPIAAGAERALIYEPPPNPPIHGPNGLGGLKLEVPDRALDPRHSVELLADLLWQEEPGSLTILAIGPLTNIALLLALHPHAAERIGLLAIMGGAIGTGNVTPVAEFNAFADPEASQRVLCGSGLPILLVPLDVTRRAIVDEDDLELFREASGAAGVIADMILGYADHPPAGWPLHDVLALAALLDPEVIRTERAAIEVDTGAGPARGQTICTFERPLAAVFGKPDPVGDVDVATEIDVDRYRDLVRTRIATIGD
ncbi:MAG: nucleoside hydrolase [Actinobacteria bacterium]|nr:nucleoside hydrolase [Actinomycetota bacterium]